MKNLISWYHRIYIKIITICDYINMLTGYNSLFTLMTWPSGLYFLIQAYSFIKCIDKMGIFAILNKNKQCKY